MKRHLAYQVPLLLLYDSPTRTHSHTPPRSWNKRHYTCAVLHTLDWGEWRSARVLFLDLLPHVFRGFSSSKPVLILVPQKTNSSSST
ncbi:hypothetical protein SADUNF_Sadunf06G0042500 [Salix dunnii]|uniref:Uncharacterized protein n=1 Tax=Salix dunnii TaxID=1413687 RepID=A0A835K319_9ROSI|nr:hypothetical protein SADUNF_Sadunf06G0042500 [Salix dunnii]